MKKLIATLSILCMAAASAVAYGKGCLYFTPKPQTIATSPYDNHIFVLDDGTAVDTRPHPYRSVCNCCPGGPQNIVKITREPNGGGYGGWITKVTCRPYTYTNTNTITVRCPCR